ncbi:uncharacterized protein LOC143198148 [Rhynchophorus ferrugineus]|uniref:uncharacterized protein LOC143198148 n=1 Tax=Rhynchophorus ferrugineus TaxID=354439 RepID=UPI003FCDF95F
MRIAAFLVLALCIAIAAAVTTPHYEVQEVREGGAEQDEKAHKFSNVKVAHAANKKTHHETESANQGKKGTELHTVEDEEGGGKKHHSHGGGSHASSHHDQGNGHHGLKYAEGSKKKKERFEKGFAEKFHKDELKKHDSFFSDGEKSGSYNIFGQKGAKYGSQAVHKHGVASSKNAKSEGKHGKSGKGASGHHSSGKKGSKTQGGNKSHYAHSEKHAKKGGKKGGSQHKYSHKRK